MRLSKSSRSIIFLALSCALLLCAEGLPAQRPPARATNPAFQPGQSLARERDVASRFAPVFYQALGDKPRYDYITNFDFDGDWRGDNNWDHATDSRFPLKGYVYYSVSETTSHIFIHYAVFHPRDYKGGELKGAILSELMREGAKRGGQYDPTGLAQESALAHENDMEGCLIVVAKNGNDLNQARVVFVETLHHNAFSKYVPSEAVPQGFDPVQMDGQKVLLYIEPKGHGIKAYDGSEQQTAKKRLLVYRFAGKAEEPNENQEGSVGYDLVPIQSTFWPRGRAPAKSQSIAGMNVTFGAVHDYASITISVLQAGGHSASQQFKLGKLGSAFFGKIGGRNMARPPWAWFDRSNRNEPLGLWFFDPAKIIKRDFRLDGSFSTTYIRLPFWAANR